MPPKPRLTTVDGAATDGAQAAAVEPVAPQPVSTFGPPFVPEPAALAEMSAEPTVTAQAPPMASPLILTPPPAEEAQAATHAAHARPVTAIASEPDEFETPLFDENWDGAQALGARIVRHEAPPEEELEGRRPVNGPFILLGAIGLAAFVGAVGAFLKAHAGTGRGAGPFDDPAILAWVLAVIGAACVGTSIYFLLKRLGGAED
jgi:hypothetical protein